MREDLERWDRKYRGLPFQRTLSPDPLLLEHVSLLHGKGRACDIACGVGHNGLFLAEKGYDSFLIDGSFIALTTAQRVAAARSLCIYPIVADLDQFSLPAASFDVIVVVRYLNRSLSDDICNALRPGGVLFFKTFNIKYLSENPGFRREYVLQPGETRKLFGSLECLFTNDSATRAESQSYFVGRQRRT